VRGDARKPLDQDLCDALEAERVAVFAPEAAKARVLDRLAITVGAMSGSTAGRGDNGGEAGSTAPTPTIARAGARFLASPLSHAVSFGVGSVAGFLVWRAAHAPPPQQIVYVERDRPVASAPSPSSDPVAIGPTVSTPPLAQTSAASNGSHGNSLAAERALLDAARSAFGRGEGDAALEALARHEKIFPNGQLAEEREALAVRSLVMTQHVGQARARGARFRKLYPGSVMLPAVDAALGAVP
jgi:hypothetical protein